MNDIKWIIRKYPKSFEKLMNYFSLEELHNFKKNKLKIGLLTKDVFHVQNYKKGSLVQFKPIKIDEYPYPTVTAILKCKVGFTESGYHEFNIHKSDVEEILE